MISRLVHFFGCFGLKVFAAGVLMLTPVVAHAQSSSSADPEAVEAIREALVSTQPNIVIDAIQPSPIPGLYEVRVEAGPTIYATADARYFIPGDLYTYSPESGGLVNLGEEQRSRLRAERIAAVDESEMIIFEADGEARATLTVFTDVDCQYCRRLHTEVPQLNEMGITVRYLAFPRTGVDTETYHKMVSTWCSANRNAIFTSATRGGDVPEADCDNPVAEQYQLGRDVGVTGTPFLVFSDGSSLPGYVPAQRLATYLLDSPAPATE